MEPKKELNEEHQLHRLSRWQEIVKEFEQSGQSRQEYCERRGIKVHQLIYWLSRLRDLAQRGSSKLSSPPQNFAPQIKGPQETFTLQINGILVKIPKSTPSEKVISIIRCLI